MSAKTIAGYTRIVGKTGGVGTAVMQKVAAGWTQVRGN